MTNREWLNTLSDRDFSAMLIKMRDVCMWRFFCRDNNSCRKAAEAWLKEEHKEVGDE